MTVGIVVPTLGRRLPWLRDSLHSILKQPDVEVDLLVVSPGKDDVADLCRQMGVRHLPLERPGLSAAVNFGWSTMLECEQLSWLGDDDLLAPSTLSAVSMALKDRPTATMVYGRVRYIDASGETMYLLRPTRFAGPYLRIGKDLVPQQGSLLRASAVRKVGLLDEGLAHAMDMDLFLKLSKLGGLAHIPLEVGAFRLHETNITITKPDGAESEVVRLRGLTPARARIVKCARRTTRPLDRLVYGTLTRLPTRGVPLLNGKPYTEPSVAS